MTPPKNIFESIPANLPNERIETLAASPHVRIERIVSRGHASPEGFWYDQPQDEWVMLLAGAARVRFAGDGGLVVLKPGDWIAIPAHVRHRVEWTTPDEPTIWLAVHSRCGTLN